MYSALQVGGRRLYDIARAGEQVERASRPIEVSEMRLLAWRPPDAEFVVRVGSGTYVRTLCRDLGVRCGSAAHLAALSRTAIGPFRLEQRGDHRGPGRAGARRGARRSCAWPRRWRISRPWCSASARPAACSTAERRSCERRRCRRAPAGGTLSDWSTARAACWRWPGWSRRTAGGIPEGLQGAVDPPPISTLPASALRAGWSGGPRPACHPSQSTSRGVRASHRTCIYMPSITM